MTAREPVEAIAVLVAFGRADTRARFGALLVDDPRMRLIGESGTVHELVHRVLRCQPRVLILEDSLLSAGPPSLARDLCAVVNGLRILLVGPKGMMDTDLNVLRRGAHGFLNYEDDSLLIRSIEAICNGELWVRRHVVHQLVAELGWAPRPLTRVVFPASGLPLTAREMQITSLVAVGQANKAIAVSLGISEQTVKHHLSSIFRKTGIRGRVTLALAAAASVDSFPMTTTYASGAANGAQKRHHCAIAASFTPPENDAGHHHRY